MKIVSLCAAVNLCGELSWEGKKEGETGTGTALTFDFDPTFVSLDELFDNVKPETHPAILSVIRVKRIKNMREGVMSNPMAGIFKGYRN